MIRRPPRSTQSRSSAASDVYKRQARHPGLQRVMRFAARILIAEIGQMNGLFPDGLVPVSYTHLRAHETVLDLVCRLLLEKKKHT